MEPLTTRNNAIKINSEKQCRLGLQNIANEYECLVGNKKITFKLWTCYNVYIVFRPLCRVKRLLFSTLITYIAAK